MLKIFLALTLKLIPVNYTNFQIVFLVYIENLYFLISILTMSISIPTSTSVMFILSMCES